MEVAKPSLGEKWRIHEELMEKGFQRHSGTSLMTGRWISEHFVTQIGLLGCASPRRIFQITVLLDSYLLKGVRVIIQPTVDDMLLLYIGHLKSHTPQKLTWKPTVMDFCFR